MKTLVLSALCLLLIAGPGWGINIAWLSFHNSDLPTVPAQADGFTEAPGQGYVDLLRANGHTVTRYVSQDPTQQFVDQLSTHDLIVVSRQVSSGNYELEPERQLWHGISKPMILMSAYILRNNRLQFYAGDDLPDHNAQSPVTLTAEVPNHPIFQGITLDANNSIQFANYPISTPNGVEQRGLSVNTSPIAGGGTLLASVGTPGDPSFGGTLIGHWPTGALLGANTLAGPRMTFMSGSREDAVAPADIDIAGIFDLTPAGSQLFLNSVCYLATCGPPLVPGDTNGNGTVTIDDFEPIRANFRKTVATRAEGDLVTNGVVDFADFREWKSAFTGAGGSLAGLDFSFATNVPEPSAIGLVLIGLCGLAIKWRGKRGKGE